LFLEIADGAWRMESEGGSLKLIEIDERRVEVLSSEDKGIRGSKRVG